VAELKITDQERAVLDRISERLGIDMRRLLEGDVRFAELEAAGHRLGRVVARAATQRLARGRAARATEPQPDPTCERS